MEDLALDRPTLEDAPLRRARAGRGERRAALAAWAGRRCRPRRSDDREHLLDEQWVAAGGACDLVPELAARTRSAISSTTSSSPSGSSLEADRPRRAQLGELRPRDAEHAGSAGFPTRGARRARRGRGTSPRPTGCRRGRRRAARRAAARSSVLRNAQAISSADVAASLSPSSERIAAAAVSSAGSTSSCFSTSTTGQYVIPSPYGRHRRVDRPGTHRPQLPPLRVATCRRRRRRRS